MGLPNTLFGVCVESGWRVVGIGRIIGDGDSSSRSWTSPSCRSTREGLGTMVMDTHVSWLRDNASTDVYVQLVAEEGTAEFYKKYGFRVRTSEMSGMSFMTL